MLTENYQSTAIFFFAHQDDEFGVFFKIQNELKKQKKVICIFVTSPPDKIMSLRRNSESKKVLLRLGVSESDIYFLGEELEIFDGKLYEKIYEFSSWLEERLLKNHAIDDCFIPAWEGGHPDHDILHAVVVKAFYEIACLNIVKQYPLYHGDGCIAPFFRVLNPLKDNGNSDFSLIPIIKRINYLGYCLCYPSQWKSWIGLFPFVLLKYFIDGRQSLQPVCIKRLLEKPHQGSLYYEARGFFSWEKMFLIMKNFLK